MTTRRRARAHGQAGFTIIELIVTIAVIVVVTAALGFALSNLRRGQLWAMAGKMDSAIRYLYQLSSIHATPFRLVLDMDEQKWWAEALTLEGTPCRSFAVQDVRKEDQSNERSARRRGSFGGKKKTQEEDERGTCADEERDAGGKCPLQGFEAVAGQSTFGRDLLEKQPMPGGVTIDGVMTTHQQDVQRGGKAYIYFFPNGNVEKAYIYLSANDRTYTVETFPLLGKVRIHNQELALGGVLREDR